MRSTKRRFWLVAIVTLTTAGMLFVGGEAVLSSSSSAWEPAGTQVFRQPGPIGPIQGTPLDVTAAITANCRYGLTGGEPFASWLATQNVGLGWYLDFSSHPAMNWIPGAEYAQLIKVHQNRDGNGNYLQSYSIVSTNLDFIRETARQSPGSLWLIGNEPDRGPTNPTDPNRIQDDTFPDVYAMAYHDLYFYIKALDPTAQIGFAGLVQITPGRLTYLDNVWQSYLNRYGTTIPVDVWNMHLYVVPEVNYYGNVQSDIGGNAKGTPLTTGRREGMIMTVSALSQSFCAQAGYICISDHDDMGEFSSQIVAMRTWMKNHGQQNRPLVLTEFGILYWYVTSGNQYGCTLWDEWGRCFTPARAAQHLLNTFNYLNSASDANIGYPRDSNRLVQQWLWYSMYGGGPSALGGPADIVAGTSPLSLSQVGNTLKTLVNDATKFPQRLNFVATGAQVKSVTPGPNGYVATVSVGVYNNGSIAPSAPVAITAYADAARTIVIGQGQLSGVRGCARREYAFDVTVNMPASAAGTTPFYITINPSNAFNETTLSDNFTEGSAFVPLTLFKHFLPLLRR